jgi:hypothetical protein
MSQQVTVKACYVAKKKDAVCLYRRRAGEKVGSGILSLCLPIMYKRGESGKVRKAKKWGLCWIEVRLWRGWRVVCSSPWWGAPSFDDINCRFSTVM